MSVPAESDVFRTLTQKASEAIGPRNACLGVAQGKGVILQRSYRLVRGSLLLLLEVGGVNYADFLCIPLRVPENVDAGKLQPAAAPRQNLVDRLNRQFVIRGVVTFNSPLPRLP